MAAALLPLLLAIAAAPGPGCAPTGFAAAAAANAASLTAFAWTPFGRGENGWLVYAPRVAAEIGTACPPQSSGFAAALAAWQHRHRTGAAGVFDTRTFMAMKAGWQGARPFVRLSGQRLCPAPPGSDRLAAATAREGYGGKIVQLRPGALAAWRRMTGEARKRSGIAAEPRAFQLFSGFRSPAYDAARCARDGNCNGVVRATCSAHRTGLALDMWVGQAPGFGPDSSADANRLAMVNTPAYRWLLANAARFGFVNYAFEPWHWEWTGEPV